MSDKWLQIERYRDMGYSDAQIGKEVLGDDYVRQIAGGKSGKQVLNSYKSNEESKGFQPQYVPEQSGDAPISTTDTTLPYNEQQAERSPTANFTQTLGGMPYDIANSYLNGATLGHSEKLAAAMKSDPRSLIGAVGNIMTNPVVANNYFNKIGANPEYQQSLEQNRDKAKQFNEEHPILDPVLQFTGGAGVMSAANKGLAAVPYLGKMLGAKDATHFLNRWITQPATAGALLSGVYAKGQDQDVPTAMTIGGATGLALKPVAKVAQKAIEGLGGVIPKTRLNEQEAIIANDLKKFRTSDAQIREWKSVLDRNRFNNTNVVEASASKVDAGDIPQSLLQPHPIFNTRFQNNLNTPEGFNKLPQMVQRYQKIPEQVTGYFSSRSARTNPDAAVAKMVSRIGKVSDGMSKLKAEAGAKAYNNRINQNPLQNTEITAGNLVREVKTPGTVLYDVLHDARAARAVSEAGRSRFVKDLPDAHPLRLREVEQELRATYVGLKKGDARKAEVFRQEILDPFKKRLRDKDLLPNLNAADKAYKSAIAKYDTRFADVEHFFENVKAHNYDAVTSKLLSPKTSPQFVKRVIKMLGKNGDEILQDIVSAHTNSSFQGVSAGKYGNVLNKAEFTSPGSLEKMKLIYGPKRAERIWKALDARRLEINNFNNARSVSPQVEEYTQSALSNIAQKAGEVIPDALRGSGVRATRNSLGVLGRVAQAQGNPEQAEMMSKLLTDNRAGAEMLQKILQVRNHPLNFTQAPFSAYSPKVPIAGAILTNEATRTK